MSKSLLDKVLRPAEDGGGGLAKLLCLPTLSKITRAPGSMFGDEVEALV